MKIIQQIDFDGEQADAILAIMRSKMPGEPSWSAVRKLLRGRKVAIGGVICLDDCLLYTSPSPRDATLSRMPSSA